MRAKLTMRQYTEMAVVAVACSDCGAKIGEHCHGRGTRKEWHSYVHVARKHAMRDFRARLPQQYADLKNGMLSETP